MDFLRVRGARTHNLKNINIDIPKHKLVVITGLSGSGKSSLAFDTLYAEGQRRYVESLSAYARQFLQMMDKPDVDLIEGLAPAIAIEQKATSHNPRSTVGTVTEIHDYLRLLYARVGDPYCPNHPEIMLSSQTISQMVDTVLGYTPESRIMLLAPVLADRKGEHAELFIELKAKGFTKVRIDGEVVELEPSPKLAKNHKHTIEVVVDRLKVRPDAKQRLAESFETACRMGNGRALVVMMDAEESAEAAKPASQLFSSKFACPICDYSLAELEPRLFSFNSPMGACPTCDGLGEIDEFEPSRIVAHPELSLASGAIKGWDRRTIFYFQMLQGLAAHYGFNIETPFVELPEEAQNAIIFGSGAEEIEFDYVSEKGKIQKRKHVFEGVLPNFRRRYLETESSAVREELSKYMSRSPCTDCQGARLRREARFVKVGDAAIFEVSRLALFDTAKFFDALKLTGAKQKIAERIIWEIKNRVGFLNNVGLEYLSLDRSAETLSGGEAQRIRLASQIGSGLTGVMYVLDEPSIGLHQRDNDRLLEMLKRLRDLGNTVIVVEHDEEVMRAADHIIDMGPEAGTHGGEVIFSGTHDQLMASDGLTAKYLTGREKIQRPKRRRPVKDVLIVKGAHENNLKGIDVAFPLNMLTVVTGVSGSGKTTLVKRILYPALRRELEGGGGERPGEFKELAGDIRRVEAVEMVDQHPIGRSSRSNPVTYVKAWDDIRQLYSEQESAKMRGYKPAYFSFNVDGGRCEVCQGEGEVHIEMQFMADISLKCEACHGKRFKAEILDVKFHGMDVADLLDMTVDDALDFFKAHADKHTAVKRIVEKLLPLQETGLGYVKLGQSSSTLSGLHFHDIAKLLKALNALIENGHSVLVIEHNLEVIACADHLIDLGPEAGDAGGSIVFEGTPEEMVAKGKGHTAHYLKAVLRRD